MAHADLRSFVADVTWREGDVVVWRNVWDGRVRNAAPLRVVEDRDQIVLWHPEGTREWVPPTGGMPRKWELVEHTAPNDVVIVYERGAQHSVRVAWQNSALLCWYVNFEDEWTRSAVGFDTRDLFLDIWVEPDHSWRFLDEDELAEAEVEGIVTGEEAAAVRAEGERVAGLIESWQPPFSEGWENFRPDPAWTIPVLPEGWDVV
jgi:hypothetical protein